MAVEARGIESPLAALMRQVRNPLLILHLDRLPDLREALRTASPQIKRQVFGSFDLQIVYDKREGRVEISATVSEAVAEALENSKTLLAGGSSVVVTNIAGARFEPSRVIWRMRAGVSPGSGL